MPRSVCIYYKKTRISPNPSLLLYEKIILTIKNLQKNLKKFIKTMVELRYIFIKKREYPQEINRSPINGLNNEEHKNIRIQYCFKYIKICIKDLIKGYIWI